MALVSLEDVGKTYRGRSGAYEAVRDFSLELAEGEFFCLLGTSGCGKTTVLNMLAGFEAPTAGRITLDGRPVSKPAAERGVVFQGTDSLYDWLNARDNIAFGLRLAGVGAVERNKIRAAQALGASRFQVFALVALPATVPFILTGMRLAMANSFVTIVAAELIASNDGLGKMLWDARLFMEINDIFVALVALGLLGFATDRCFRLAIRAFAGRYNPTM